MFTTLVTFTELAEHLEDPNWVILDCRFALAEPERGLRDYLAGHIPRAVYAHLDKDLAGPVQRGVTGRHPLPGIEQAAATFSAWGIDAQTQVVAYDDAGGALAAVRAWWMLRWLGHSAVAVLNGGWQAWLKAGLLLRSGSEMRTERAFIPAPRPELALTTAEVDAARQDAAYIVADSRAAERYRGENETIDPVAGHIPGAISIPYGGNLTPDGLFRTPEELRARFQALLGNTPPEHTVFYCGSGVTSIHNILAMQVAGLGEARLYPGSWSEWIADGQRPVAV